MKCAYSSDILSALPEAYIVYFYSKRVEVQIKDTEIRQEKKKNDVSIQN